MKKILITSFLSLGLFTSFASAFELNSGNILIVAPTCTKAVTYCSLSNITYNGTKITSIARDTFSGYSNMTSLNLSSNQITNIGSCDFNGLSNLNSLTLNYNQITNIESGDFVGLPALSRLYMLYNQLTGIDEDDFINLPVLENLDILGNNIKDLKNCNFNGLSRLKQLNLRDINITSIESGDFVGLSGLTILSLPYNQITGIDEGDFYGLFNLKKLDLSSNNITSIESGDFIGLSGLTYLDLGKNQLTSIDKGDFYGLDSLYQMQIGSNQINSIADYGFSGAYSLSNLSLVNNQISSIDTNDFAGLPNLSSITLNANKFLSIKDLDFSNIPTLTNITLQYTNITSIKKGDFDKIPSIQYIDFYGSKISNIESGSFSGLSGLNTIRLTNNQLTSIDEGVFAGIPNILNIDLTSNQIAYIDNKSFSNLSSLKYITLSSNPISYIDPKSFNNLPALTSINTTNTSYAGYINYTGGIRQINDTYYGIISSNDPASFISTLSGKLYAIGGGILGGSDYYIGKNPLNFSAGVTNKILVNTVMKSIDNKIEVQYNSGTEITSSGGLFTGVLIAPIIINTGNISNLSNIVSATKFGDPNERIDFSQPVTVRLPALGKNFGDSVKIYYTQNLSDSRDFHTTTTVINIGGVPYVEFDTDHATYFAIGEGTGSFTINNDDPSTNSELVTLNISGAGITNMRFSNTSGSNWSEWEPYSTNKIRTLTGGAGINTVYAEFDTDNDTGTIEASSFDIIEFVGLGNTQGNITLTITGGVTECIYGTSLYLGAQDGNLDPAGYTFSGDFSPVDRYCADFKGLDGWAFYIHTSDLENDNSNIISGSNVLISHDGATVQGHTSCTGYDGTPTPFNNGTGLVLMEKANVPDNNKICQVDLTNVKLQVNVPPYQAPGDYVGTLTITVPNGFNE